MKSVRLDNNTHTITTNNILSIVKETIKIVKQIDSQVRELRKEFTITHGHKEILLRPGCLAVAVGSPFSIVRIISQI